MAWDSYLASGFRQTYSVQMELIRIRGLEVHNMKITLATTGAVTNSNTRQPEQAKREKETITNIQCAFLSGFPSQYTSPETICNDEVADEA